MKNWKFWWCQLFVYSLWGCLWAVGIQMSSKSECHYRQIFGGWGHTTTNTVSLTKMLRCFSLRIKMLRCRRPLRDFSSCYHFDGSLTANGTGKFECIVIRIPLACTVQLELWEFGSHISLFSLTEWIKGASQYVMQFTFCDSVSHVRETHYCIGTFRYALGAFTI